MQTLNPEHLIPIRNLSLRAKLIVEGVIAGMHKSPFHGFSAEFLEYRSFTAGDNASRIDWRKYAKSDRTVVKLFEDETNLFANILIDKSGSMGFKLSGVSKFEYARTLAAAIAWILIRQRDAVGLAVFDDRVKTYLQPRSTNIQLKHILGTLDKITPHEQTQCAAAINTLASGLKKRGMCIIISDFMDNPETIRQGLRHLRYKRQDILMLQILDSQELMFKQKGMYKFRDLESGADIKMDGRTASEYFNKGMSIHNNMLRSISRELQIDYEQVCTNEPFSKALIRILDKREKLL
jgi:uncharacterized protein (DUF58 family)